jgi:tripartite ATP-independent transporter DctM subunit
MSMPSPFTLSLLAIVALSLLGLPIGLAMVGATVLYLASAGLDVGTAAEQILNGLMNSYLLLAIPLFVLAAEFMSAGSIMDRLVHFCNALVGRFRGGLALVNVAQAIVFSSMSGSALADAAGSGKLMQALMTREGKYTRPFAAALTAVAATIGPIIPPSIPLVVYSIVSDASVGYLFLAGVIPGLLIGAVQMALIVAMGKRRNFPVEMRVPPREMLGVTKRAFPALLMPLILFTCMYGGITTPTEAAAVAAAYALLIAGGLYRSIGPRHIYRSLLSSARTTVSIGMLIAGAMAFNYVITIENIPKTVSAILTATNLSQTGFLLLVNLILLVLGCLLEGTTIILVILPVLLPTATALGVDPVHFGVMAVVNIMYGLVTPPYGLLLFMMTKIADVSLRDIVREVLPFLGVMLIALLIITYVPDLVLFLPRLFGYSG